jgi:citrate synthase
VADLPAKAVDPVVSAVPALRDLLFRRGGSRRPGLGRRAQAARRPEFISYKLYPTVDFYSGIIYKALGIPVNMYTVLFAIGRMPGWIGQWLEGRNDPDNRIARLRQIYTGATQRAYVAMEQR